MARSNTEASVAAREMARNRVLAIDERFGDLGIRLPRSSQLQHLALTGRRANRPAAPLKPRTTFGLAP